MRRAEPAATVVYLPGRQDPRYHRVPVYTPLGNAPTGPSLARLNYADALELLAARLRGIDTAIPDEDHARRAARDLFRAFKREQDPNRPPH